MRKNQQIADRRSKNQQVRKWRRKIKSAERKRARSRDKTIFGRSSHRMILCPFALNITGKKNRRHTLRFFEKIRRVIIDHRAPLTINLSNLQFMLPSGALLLISELDRAKRIAGDDFQVRLIPSENDRMNAVLDQIGFSELCGTKLGSNPIDGATDDSVRHWRYATGVRINDQTERAFTDIQGRLAAPLHKGIWVGISEAIGNAVLHAYLEPRGTDKERLGTKRWWMLSQERDGVLSVAVTDLGIGIPRSLPLTWPRSALDKILDGIRGKGPDERAIRAAIEVGATSTGKSHRGNGLPQIWKELRSAENADIAIHSNKGSIYWNGRSKTEQSQEYDDSIFGTIINWSVPVLEA